MQKHPKYSLIIGLQQKEGDCQITKEVQTPFQGRPWGCPSPRACWAYPRAGPWARATPYPRATNAKKKKNFILYIRKK